MLGSLELLSTLIRASYPVIYVISYEENRVESSLLGMLGKKNQKYGSSTELWRWSLTEGLVNNSTGVSQSNIDSPVDALEFIEDYESSAVFVLRDFGYFLTEGPAYMVGRKLKDVANTISSEGKSITIVLLDSELTIPPRMEKLITVVDFDLPCEKDIRAEFSELISVCSGEDSERVDLGIKSALGLTFTEIENVFAKSYAMEGTISPQVVIKEKKNIIKKSGVLEYYDLTENLNSVGGLNNLKDWLKLRGKAFSEEASNYGLPTPKGVLIVGVPGTGKSLVSKCIGMEWSMPVLRLDVGSLFGSLVGQSEGNMRKALKTAESLAPCVLWIDELEKSFGQQGSLDGGTSTRVFGYFLSWMQEKKSQVFVVATANDVSALPPEMLRKGRFDELFFVDLPSVGEIKEILEIHIKRLGRDPSLFDLDKIARAASNFSGAELESVVVEALYKGFYENREPTTEDMIASVKTTVPLHDTMKEGVSRLRSWASGRAVPAGKPSIIVEDKTTRGRYSKLLTN